VSTEGDADTIFVDELAVDVGSSCTMRRGDRHS